MYYSRTVSLLKRFVLGGGVIAKTEYQSDLSADEKLLMSFVRAAEAFKRSVSSTFRKYRLSFPQYNVLRVLDASGDGQSRITNVSRIMLVPGANMTGIAKRLEKSGFITRKSDPRDERVTLLEITEKGRNVLSRIEKERDEHMEAMLRGFPEEEKRELLEKVSRLIRNSRRKI
jgi:DNA-binding MarR family transcriptional regulator